MKEVSPKVFLGLSGGVDSAVAAALLKKAGYQVTGVFIRAWEPDGYPCLWPSERRDAMRVAARLDLPLLTLDLSREYKQEVVDYLLAEYARGRTPNPDVMCNKQIKFGAFYRWALARGADFVATGHYAQIKKGRLCRAQDKDKDQTYFLWPLKTEQLAKILFPIGHLTKPKVRRLAEKFNLPNAEKRDSQGLCFVGPLDFKNFLRQQLKSRPGVIFNERGEIIGEHQGAIFYTIGERHGLAITKKTSQDKPYYVFARDLAANALAASQSPKILAKFNPREVILRETNWVNGPPPNFQKKYQARIRHRGELTPCRLKVSDELKICFITQAPRAIASGQSLVLYSGQICLGGGVIA